MLVRQQDEIDEIGRDPLQRPQSEYEVETNALQNSGDKVPSSLARLGIMDCLGD